MMNKILILVGGGTRHLEPFNEAAKKMRVDLTTASFSRLEYLPGKELAIEGKDLSTFDVIYLRLIGKRSEDAAFVVSYAKEKGVRVVDRIYEMGKFVRLPLTKSIEARILTVSGIPVPKTYFSTLKNIGKNAGKLLGFPFVVKGTMGKQGNAVWLPETEEEIEKLVEELTPQEKEGTRFMAQEFIKASQRERLFVVGEKVVAGITRPMRWRKRFTKKVGGKYPEGKRQAKDKVAEEDEKLAVSAAQVLGIDIAGVDLIKEDSTGKAYIMEVNSAPGWKSIEKDTGVNIEREILEFLTQVA